jgi:murein DD-endopeptidase MepM/ murein hydrolase activator NlpD
MRNPPRPTFTSDPSETDTTPEWINDKNKIFSKLNEFRDLTKSLILDERKIKYLERNNSLDGFNPNSINLDEVHIVRLLQRSIDINQSCHTESIFRRTYSNTERELEELNSIIKKGELQLNENSKKINKKLKAIDQKNERDAKNEATKNAKKESEEKARKEAEEKAIKEAEEKAIKEAEEKAIKEAEARVKKEEKERRKQAFLEEQKLRQELAEKTRIEEEKLQTELAYNAKREAEAQAKQEEIEKQIKQQQIEEIKNRILEKTSANFEKFQPFLDFLREKKYLDIGEIGLFGSRVYKEVINETCPQRRIVDNRGADYDIFCIPKNEQSQGIFVTYPNQFAAEINFGDLIEEFNAKNPNLQISFLKEENGKKNVNHGGKKTNSLNFKLVARTSEEEVDFDLNFYTKQSMLKNLQWQFNIERVMLSQVSDGSFQLKINQSNCDPSQEKMTIEKFISEAQNSEQEDFLFEANPQARGFLNRIINAKGIYKYLDEETLDAIKIELLNDPAILENLKEELSFYKDILDRNNDSEAKKPSDFKEKIALAKLIIEGIKEDKIFKDVDDFKRILESEPKTVTTQPQIDSKLKTR